MADKYSENRLMVLNEPQALRISPALAKEIGLHESIVLLQIEYLIAISGHEREGKRWTYQSLSDLRGFFPFWGESTIDRAIRKLARAGLLVIGNFNRRRGDQTRWFALGDGVSQLKSVSVSQREPSQIGTARPDSGQPVPDRDSPSHNGTSTSQNGTTLPKITTKTSTESTRERESLSLTPTPSALPAGMKEEGIVTVEEVQTSEGVRYRTIYHVTPSQLYEYRTGAKPNAAQVGEMDSTVGDLALWDRVLEDWLLSGNQPRNVRGLLDWYDSGGCPYRKRDSDGWFEA